MSEHRTWGPFNGRHLTAIIVAIVVGAVLIPSTVWAVDTFSNVAIEDPVTGAKASVDATHHRWWATVLGPLTVDGTVTSHETPLSQLVHRGDTVRLRPPCRD